MNQKEKQQLKKLLQEKKRQLENELAKIADKNPLVEGDYKARYPHNADSNDTKDERASDETLWEANRAVEQSLEEELRDISATLKKLEADDYGLCSNCKSPIESPRLKAMPTVSLCFGCANKPSLL